jgi:hypothetical protein
MLRGFWKFFNNARAIVLAVIVHIVVLGVLVVNMEWVAGLFTKGGTDPDEDC